MTYTGPDQESRAEYERSVQEWRDRQTGMYVVVGRFSRTVYGPFGTLLDAEQFIRYSLHSNERQYNIERATSAWLREQAAQLTRRTV